MQHTHIHSIHIVTHNSTEVKNMTDLFIPIRIVLKSQHNYDRKQKQQYKYLQK